jgi:beta-N-acetylhexosaminidase
VPVLDVPDPQGHEIIGDRAYGDTPEQVATLGRAAAEGCWPAGSCRSSSTSPATAAP